MEGMSKTVSDSVRAANSVKKEVPIQKEVLKIESALIHTHSSQMRRLLSRKSKETIQRPIENEVDYQEGILRVSAPQFNKINYPVKLNSRMTAGDLLTK